MYSIYPYDIMSHLLYSYIPKLIDSFYQTIYYKLKAPAVASAFNMLIISAE